MRLACPSCQKPFEADDDLAGAPGLLLCEPCTALAATPPPHVPRPRLLSSPFLEGPESGDPVSLRDLEPSSDGEPVSLRDLEPASLPDLDSVAAVAPPPTSFGIGVPRKPVIPKVLPSVPPGTPTPAFAAIRIPAPRPPTDAEPPSEDEPKVMAPATSKDVDVDVDVPTPAVASVAEPTPTVPSAVEPTSAETTPDSAEADRRVLAMRHDGEAAHAPDSGVVGLHGGLLGQAKPKPSVLVDADESLPSSRRNRGAAQAPGLLAPVLQIAPATPRSTTPTPVTLGDKRPTARTTDNEERKKPNAIASWSLAVSSVSISAAVIVVTLYGRSPAPTATSAESARVESAPQGETPPARTRAREEPAPNVVASATSVPTVATSAGPTRPAVATSAATTAATPATTTPPTSPSTPAVATTAPPSAPANAGAAFDKAAAKAALATAAAQATACKQPEDPEGGARVLVTFAPSGRVHSAQVVGSPFQGTRTGACIARAFKGLNVPAFDGEPVQVTKDVSIR
jgi:hypothetical protein